MQCRVTVSVLMVKKFSAVGSIFAIAKFISECAIGILENRIHERCIAFTVYFDRIGRNYKRFRYFAVNRAASTSTRDDK